MEDDNNAVSKALVCLSDGRKMFIDGLYATYVDLRENVCEVFKIKRENIVAIYHRVPAELLAADSDNLIQFDSKIFVQLKTQPIKLAGSPQTNRLSCVLRIYTLSDVFQALVGTNYFWHYLEQNPNLFCKSGIVYNYLQFLYGIVHNHHYKWSYFLPFKTLVYDEKRDCIELCIPKVDHTQINERLKDNVAVVEYYVAELNIPSVAASGKPTDVELVIPAASCAHP